MQLGENFSRYAERSAVGLLRSMVIPSGENPVFVQGRFLPLPVTREEPASAGL